MSDIDICLFVQDCVVEHSLAVEKRKWAEDFGTTADSLTIYTESSAKHMASLGSLFLWHLLLEGEIRYQANRFASNLLSTLQRFDRHQAEVGEYHELVSDVFDRVNRRALLDECDMHVLQVAVRNTCILITHYFGAVAFGRSDAFARAKKVLPSIPLDEVDFAMLTSWHLAYTRGVKPAFEIPTLAEAESLVRRTMSLVVLAAEVFK